jgi:hypothetical protein
VLPCPNPNPRTLRIQVDGACDRLELAVFDTGMVLVELYDGPGAAEGGWVSVPAPANLENGLHYCRVRAWRGGVASAPAIAKLYILR